MTCLVLLPAWGGTVLRPALRGGAGLEAPGICCVPGPVMTVWMFLELFFPGATHPELGVARAVLESGGSGHSSTLKSLRQHQTTGQHSPQDPDVGPQRGLLGGLFHRAVELPFACACLAVDTLHSSTLRILCNVQPRNHVHCNGLAPPALKGSVVFSSLMMPDNLGIRPSSRLQLLLSIACAAPTRVWHKAALCSSPTASLHVLELRYVPRRSRLWLDADRLRQGRAGSGPHRRAGGPCTAS